MGQQPQRRETPTVAHSEDGSEAAPRTAVRPGERSAPVGVMDSGVGGLTILAELLRELPFERFVYFGDTGNCPYGIRSEQEIQALALAAARHLLAQQAKVIVVACNTASVSALAELRAELTVPFIGVVPAVKPAAERTRMRRIGVAATEASARGTYLQRLIAEHASGVNVLAVGCPRLVTLVEEGLLDGPEIEATIRDYIAPLLEAGIDELVLGCTHFPALRAAFERVVGPQVDVIDSGAAVARQTRRVLTERAALADAAPPGAAVADGARVRFWCSGPVASFERVASAILGRPVQAQAYNAAQLASA